MRGNIHYTDAADGHSGGRGRCRRLTERGRTHAEQDWLSEADMSRTVGDEGEHNIQAGFVLHRD